MDTLARFNLRNKKVVNAFVPLTGEDAGNAGNGETSAKSRTGVASGRRRAPTEPLPAHASGVSGVSGVSGDTSGASDRTLSDCEEANAAGPSVHIEDLPLELLELVLDQLRRSIVRSRVSRKTGKVHRLGKEDVQALLAVCGVSRRWRDAGRRVIFKQPWELITRSGFCYQHPNQMFAKSPVPPLGSRSGLFKCFMRREQGTGRAAGLTVMTMYSGKFQSSKVGFMLSAVGKGRSSYQMFLEGASEALEKGVQPCARLDCNLLCTRYTLRASERMMQVLEEGFGVRDYQEAIPVGISEEMSSLQLAGETVRALAGRREGRREGRAAAEDDEVVLRDRGNMEPARRERREGDGEDGGDGGDGEDGEDGEREERGGRAQSGASADVLLKLQYKARVRGIMQPRRMEVSPTDCENLHNKPPHWNAGLNCWCLNFHGRVKLASVKNFQLVQEGAGVGMDDPIAMQFGKIEENVFVLDFNPEMLSPVQAFGVALSTFNGRLL